MEIKRPNDYSKPKSSTGGGGGGGSHRPFLKAEIAGNLLVAVLHLDAFHSCSSELQSRRLLYNS